MLLLYVVYCIALAFNTPLERIAKAYARVKMPWLPVDEEQPLEQSALVTSYKNLQDERQGYSDPNAQQDQQQQQQQQPPADSQYLVNIIVNILPINLLIWTINYENRLFSWWRLQ